MSQTANSNVEGSAIVLAASTEPGQITAGTTSLNAGATLGVANIQNLRNPLDVPILVDEILFYIYGGPGIDIRLGLKLGSDDLVKQYTPIVLLGAARNLSVANGASGPTPLVSQINQQLFGMRLSSELILYPSEFLNPIFYHAGQYNQDQASVRIIVRCRAMKASAQRQSLPWICYWVGAQSALGASYTEETTPGDLFNPYSVPLTLDRMVGGVGSSNFASYLYGDPTSIDAGLNYALIRMVDGMGAPIIRDYTPFGHLFQLMDYSWRLKGTMPPNSFWKAYLQENYGTANFSVTTPKTQLMMSLIGHRSISGKAQGS